MRYDPKNILIGLFVFAALFSICCILYFLHPSLGDEKRILKVRFDNIEKVTSGTRVLFAGNPVGQVIDVREIEEAVQNRKAINGTLYVYELTLRVDSKVNIYKEDRISLKTSGLLGEKDVSIDPRPVSGDLHLINDEILYAYDGESIESVLREFKQISSKFDKTLDYLSRAFDHLEQQNLWESIGSTAKNISKITESIHEQNLVADTLTDIQTTFKKINESWSVVTKILNNIYTVSEKGRTIVDDMEFREGNFGKFLVGNELYCKMNQMLDKGNIIMNDVNHYGFLFHLNKGWQRTRTKRMNLLQNIKNPYDFREYFTKELDIINTSLERVSLLAEKTQPNEANKSGKTEFSKAYEDLLQKLFDIETELKIYNKQILYQKE